ncbi:MAG: glycerophosphodiester phosphodiesterase [Verrucomicrobiae bacterium]|nr:glycerophosphodiester phosphodiesterase [Verrucomicrobiae bacterium]
MSTNSSPPRIIAHRGASHDAPENTLAAFHLAWEQGADAIETDGHLTRDGEVVCIHDPTTGRTADRNLRIADSLSSELRQLDVGAWKSPRFAGQRIPTLAETLSVLPRKRRLYLEIKSGPETVAAVRARIAAAGLPPSRVEFMSFHPAVVAACKAKMPRHRAHLLVNYTRAKVGSRGAFSPTAAEVAGTLGRCRADDLGTEANPEAVTPAFLRALRRGGPREFFVWTVNDRETARHFLALGTRAIATNRPKEMRGWLRDLASRRSSP